MTPEYLIACLAVLIQLIGVYFYIRAMVAGQAKPNRVSWVIWALAPLIGSWLSWKAGAGLSVLPVFMAGFNPALVLVASFIIKNGYWEITKFDIYCGVIAFMALIIWILTQSFHISILFAILSDALAALPTINKSWNFPETENLAPYLGGIIANILGLFIIKEWTFPIYSLGIYFVLLNCIIIFCIYRKKIFNIV